MSQDGAGLPCRTDLSPGPAPRAQLQVAVPLAASLVAHAAVVAALDGRRAAPVMPAGPPAEWLEAPEPVNMEPVAPADAPGEEGSEFPAAPAAQTGDPEAHASSDAPPALVNLPPPDAVPGAHAGAPLDDKARAAWWESARKTCVGPLDSRKDCYDAIRAQIAGWNPKLVTGTYIPGRGISHPDEMPSRRVPASAISSVIQANMDRFRVCHGVGLPQSATISGEVIVTFIIEPDGHVSEPRDAGGTFPDDAVRRCVVSAAAQLSFPDPPTGSAQEVTIRVTLQSQEALARPDTRSSDPLFLPP